MQYYLPMKDKINHADKARELFLAGYNCSQAVLGAFCEDLGLDFDTAMKLSSSFGGGMGRMRLVCGAVSGMFMVSGLRDGFVGNAEVSGSEKAAHYERIQKLARAFEEKNGSIVCAKLLGLDDKLGKTASDVCEASTAFSHIPEQRTKEYYKKRPCAELVAMAASILDGEED